jgi:hypothetical protein
VAIFEEWPKALKPSYGDKVMLDLLMLTIAVVFFVLSWAYVKGTEKL